MNGNARRALVVYGGWEGHEPAAAAGLVADWLAADGFVVERSDSLECYLDSALMQVTDLVVQCWTMGDITPAQFAGLRDAIRSGTGLGGWHGGLCDAFRDVPEYHFMTGGQWVAHPGGSQREYAVDFAPTSDDPIIAGLAGFHVCSEQYYLHVDPRIEVLATTTFSATPDAPWVDGCVMPVVWKHRYGLGRVFYTSIGHRAVDLSVPEVSLLLRRGLTWASR